MKQALPIRCSAPGSLMLLGEHAVLHGSRALVCAINRRIQVELMPLDEPLLTIDSSLGHYSGSLSNLPDHPSFRFVLEAVRMHRGRMPGGLALQISSEFSADIGFGSSAAVTVAVQGALHSWVAGESPDLAVVFEDALKTVHAVQGRGSGSDLAAATFGGITAYRVQPREIVPVPVSLPMVAVYCGYKTPTPDVIRHVEALRADNPAKYEQIYAEMDAYAGEGVEALRQGDYSRFGDILNANQQLMTDMGVNTPELKEITDRLQREPGIYGAKISGSGLGDCAVGIGEAGLDDLAYPNWALAIEPVGLRFSE